MEMSWIYFFSAKVGHFLFFTLFREPLLCLTPNHLEALIALRDGEIAEKEIKSLCGIGRLTEIKQEEFVGI